MHLIWSALGSFGLSIFNSVDFLVFQQARPQDVLMGEAAFL